MILSGNSIWKQSIIRPCCQRTKFNGMTYGLGPAGYDVRVEFDNHGFISNIILNPGEFSLASTIEEFRMPSNVVGIVHDKSTWARLGLAVQNTVIEPGWRGYLTLELTNHGKKPLNIETGSPIAQIIFHQIDDWTDGYDGKYQDQERGPVQPILEK